MVLAGPRVYYAMARDGVFLPAAGRVHPRYRTPMLAIAAQAVWSAVLVLSGTLSQLVAYTGFAVVLFSGDRRDGALRAAPPRPGRRAPVPRARLSARARALRDREPRDGGQRDLEQPGHVARRASR